jgi:DNA-binding GntR family transcriptional regulator
VAKVTLDTVLDALDAEGLIRRRQGSGIYVRRRPARKRADRRSRHVALFTELNLLHPRTSLFFARGV